MIKKENTVLNISKFYHTAHLHLSPLQMTAYWTILQKPIPTDSCLKKLTVRRKNTADQTVIRGAETEGPEIHTKQEMTITVVTDFKKCGNTPCNCAFNILNGKCTDPYVVENIGKKFFPNAYAKKR